MSEPRDPRGEEARRLLREAGEECWVATGILNHEKSPPRSACFHAHLAAEKALKATLTIHGIAYRKIHDLLELWESLPSDERNKFDEADLHALLGWDTFGRYERPIEPTGQEAVDRVDASLRVVDVARRLVKPGVDEQST